MGIVRWDAMDMRIHSFWRQRYPLFSVMRDFKSIRPVCSLYASGKDIGFDRMGIQLLSLLVDIFTSIGT